MFKCVAENSISDRVTKTFIVHGNYSMLITILVVVLVVVILMFLILFFCYRKFVKHRYAPLLQSNKDFKIDTEKSLFSQSNDLPYHKEFEFPRSRLELVSKVGSGQFGEVYVVHFYTDKLAIDSISGTEPPLVSVSGFFTCTFFLQCFALSLFHEFYSIWDNSIVHLILVLILLTSFHISISSMHNLQAR